MKDKKGLALAFAGTLLVGSLAGCCVMAVCQGRNGMPALPDRVRMALFQDRGMAGTAQSGGGMPTSRSGCMTASCQDSVMAQEGYLSQTTYGSADECTTYAVYAGNTGNHDGNENTYERACAERFKIYEQFGLTYDAAEDELYYNGKTVRWFEDYYPVGNDAQEQAGIDFWNENGVVDVYAVRDLDDFVRAGDGSYDPGGKLTGLREFTEEEFAARDIEAIKNPPLPVTFAGNPASAEEMQEMAKEYEAFGLTYDAKTDQWYFNGEKVRYFRDILTSNGESLGSGKFRGAMRSFGSEDGTVDVYPVRDYTKVNDSGYGTLTGIETEEVTSQRPGERADYTVYEPYGLIYDEKTGCYTYNGSIVRFFNDPAAGAGFTNFFTGTVDIEAVRNADNKLTGIVECSKEIYDYHTERAGRIDSLVTDPGGAGER
ncbi:MAG: hypothetical protein K2P59_01375 [Acetatifactor sp.]|nr:hypothetical protein [Acetatifactor sp.]